MNVDKLFGRYFAVMVLAPLVALLIPLMVIAADRRPEPPPAVDQQYEIDDQHDNPKRKMAPTPRTCFTLEYYGWTYRFCV